MDQNPNIPEETRAPVETAAPRTAFQTNVPPFECRVISGFCGLDASALDSLNRELGTLLTEPMMERLIGQYKTFEHRDPTVGEIRLLDALVGLTGGLPERVGTGEMLTDSDEMASVWADAMERRRLLNGGGSAPCTLPELLGLPGRWLVRMGKRPAHNEKSLFVGRDASALALCRSNAPVVRLKAADGTPCLLTSAYSRAVQRPLPGDLLVLARGLSVRTADTLLRTAPTQPLIAEAIPLMDRPLPLAALDGLNGLLIKLERLFDTADDDMIPRLCSGEGMCPGQGELTMILRLRADRLKPFFNEVQRYGFKASVFGRVEGDGRLTVTYGNTRVCGVSLTFLRGLTAPRLCRIRLPEAAAPDADTCARPALFRLPIPYEGEGDVIPAGSETVALTSGTVDTAPIAGTMLAAVHDTLPDDGTAYRRAMRAVQAAVSDAAARGADRDGLSLSVMLTGKAPRLSVGCGLPVSDSTAWAAACGLYRASCELCLPITFSDVRFTLTAGEPDTLTVYAWGPLTGDTAFSPADKQPTAVLPVLRKDREADLKALSALLALRGIRGVIQPVRVELLTPPAPPVPADGAVEAEADSETAAITPAPVPAVTAAAAQTLIRALDQADLLVLAMPAEDGEILFRDPALIPALTDGRKVLAVGGVCRRLAEAGLLPETLSGLPEAVPAAGRVLTMEVTGADGCVRTMDRLCRADLSAYPADAAHRLTIHADGTDVADGFVGLTGDLTAYVNGLPDSLVL